MQPGADNPFHDLALTESPDGVTIPVRAVPRAGRDAIDGVAEGALRVRLAAPPVEGAANRALVATLAGALGVPKRDVAIVAGAGGRQKRVRVRGLTASEVRRRLARRADAR
jgi:uncharacterized protein